MRRGLGAGASRYGGERSGRKDGLGARKQIALLEADMRLEQQTKGREARGVACADGRANRASTLSRSEA